MQLPPEEQAHGPAQAVYSSQIPPRINVRPFIACIASVLIGFFCFNSPVLKTLAFGASGVFFAQALLSTRYEPYVKSVISIVFGTLILIVLTTDLAKNRLINTAVFMIFYGLAGLFGGIIVRKIKAVYEKSLLPMWRKNG